MFITQLLVGPPVVSHLCFDSKYSGTKSDVSDKKTISLTYHLVSVCFSFQEDEHHDYVHVDEKNADCLIGSSSERQVFLDQLQRDMELLEIIDHAMLLTRKTFYLMQIFHPTSC